MINRMEDAVVIPKTRGQWTGIKPYKQKKICNSISMDITLVQQSVKLFF